MILSNGEVFEMSNDETIIFHSLMCSPIRFLWIMIYKLQSNKFITDYSIIYKDELVSRIISLLRKASDTLHGHTLPADYDLIDNLN